MPTSRPRVDAGTRLIAWPDTDDARWSTGQAIDGEGATEPFESTCRWALPRWAS